MGERGLLCHAPLEERGRGESLKRKVSCSLGISLRMEETHTADWVSVKMLKMSTATGIETHPNIRLYASIYINI